MLSSERPGLIQVLIGLHECTEFRRPSTALGLTSLALDLTETARQPASCCQRLKGGLNVSCNKVLEKFQRRKPLQCHALQSIAWLAACLDIHGKPSRRLVTMSRVFPSLTNARRRKRLLHKQVSVRSSVQGQKLLNVTVTC